MISIKSVNFPGNQSLVLLERRGKAEEGRRGGGVFFLVPTVLFPTSCSVPVSSGDFGWTTRTVEIYVCWCFCVFVVMFFFGFILHQSASKVGGVCVFSLGKGPMSRFWTQLDLAVKRQHTARDEMVGTFFEKKVWKETGNRGGDIFFGTTTSDLKVGASSDI